MYNLQGFCCAVWQYSKSITAGEEIWQLDTGCPIFSPLTKLSSETKPGHEAEGTCALMGSEAGQLICVDLTTPVSLRGWKPAGGLGVTAGVGITSPHQGILHDLLQEGQEL